MILVISCGCVQKLHDSMITLQQSPTVNESLEAQRRLLKLKQRAGGYLVNSVVLEANVS